jgi:cell pole-organizing protein PopZ
MQVNGNAAMSQPAKAQEPSMEEILASIRRIIADDDSSKAAAKPAAAPPPQEAVSPPPKPGAPSPPPSTNMNQSDVDAVMAGFDSPLPAPEPAPKDDVLELTEAMATPPPEPAAFQTIDGQPDVVFADVPPEPPPLPPAADVPPEPPMRPPAASAPAAQPLISSATSAAVDSAFNTLAQTVLVQNARTLEDLVREMLRPMLKSWLDDNLPGIVERIVRAEIERVSRGR